MTGDLINLLIHDLKLPVERLTDDAGLDHAGFDSLAVVELSVLLTDRFGIDVSDSDIRDAATLGRLDLLVTSRRSGR